MIYVLALRYNTILLFLFLLLPLMGLSQKPNLAEHQIKEKRSHYSIAVFSHNQTYGMCAFHEAGNKFYSVNSSMSSMTESDCDNDPCQACDISGGSSDQTGSW